MRGAAIALVLLALACATACGAEHARPLETTSRVAALLRGTWGATVGFRSFEYSCTGLDAHGELFTCLARDQTGLVKLASFDVVCESSGCRWTAYPSYVG